MQNAQLQKNLQRSLYPQIIVLAANCMIGISAGLVAGHSAVLLPHLQSSNSTIQIEEDIGSWIASVHTLISPVGCLLGGFATEFWGRRKIKLLANTGVVIGWAIITGAQGTLMILLGRIVEGMARGMESTTSAVWVDEITDPRFRASSMTASYLCLCIGILAISTLGALVDWRTASGIAAGVTALSVITSALLSESPTWLVRKNRIQEAERSLSWLWGPGRELQVAEELRQLKTRFWPQNHENEGRKRSTVDITQIWHSFKTFFKPSTLKPFFISHVFCTIQSLCGFTLFTFYSVDILSKLKRREIYGPDEYFANILISIVRIIVVAALTFSMIRVNRRLIAITSGLGSSIFSISLAVFLYVQATVEIPGNIEAWINFSLLLIYCGFNSSGFLMLPTIMMGEMQPAHIRSYVCGYIFTMNDFVLGGIIKAYPSLYVSIGIQGLFLLFGVSCLTCTIFVYLFLPETRGRSLLEIEDYFKQSNFMWISREKKNYIFATNKLTRTSVSNVN